MSWVGWITGWLCYWTTGSSKVLDMGFGLDNNDRLGRERDVDSGCSKGGDRNSGGLANGIHCEGVREDRPSLD